MYTKLPLLFLSITIFLTVSLFPPQNSVALSATLVGDKLYSKDTLTITIDGEKLQLSDPVLVKYGHTLLPMRAIYEALGAQIYWDKQRQTASAVRNNKTIDLTIDSKIAFVDNKPISLTTPSIMYKYRTYVPLRFVSEHFNGKVTYNHDKQTISIITLQQPPPDVSDPYTLHLNNKRIMMDEPAIVRNARNYIPAKYFYEYLENSSNQWLDPETLELQIEGLVFTFRNNQSNILINQEPTLSSEAPFIVGDQMYVPVHFIVNALGGNLRFRNDTKEIYVYLNQFMFHSKFLPKQEGSLKTPILIPGAELVGNRQLLVSDNPETLTPDIITTPMAALSSHNVQTNQQSNNHRVFGWHFNKLGKKVKLGITVENKSETNTLTIPASSGVVKTSNNSWINYDIGLPIADAVLNNRLQLKNSQDLIIKPGETALIDHFDLYPGYIIGFLNDFTIESNEEANYVIRTVLSDTEDTLASVHSEPVPVNKGAAHPRGAWTHSSITATLPPYKIGADQQGYNVSNGRSDHLLTAENSLSVTNGAIGNPGHFGLTYHINVPLINETGSTQTVRLKATGRGGLYSGAIKVNGDIHLIPTLKPNKDYVELIDYPVEPGENQITVDIMHAGGASLPVAIYIETLN